MINKECHCQDSGFPILYSWKIDKQTSKMSPYSCFSDYNRDCEISGYLDLLKALSHINAMNKVDEDYTYHIGVNGEAFEIKDGSILLNDHVLNMFGFDPLVIKAIFTH